MTTTPRSITLPRMPSQHQIPASVRRELIELISAAVKPDAPIAEARQRLADVLELLQQDDLRSGYASSIWARIVRQGRHMIWTGAGQNSGDGRPVCNFRGKRIYAAKAVWYLEKLTPVPDDCALVKLCDTPRCVAPDCHEPRSREDVRGRPFNIRRDAFGRPLCRASLHVLKRDPRPREKVYCSACEKAKRTYYDEALAADRDVQRFTQTALRNPYAIQPAPQHTSESQPDDLDLARKRVYVVQLDEFMQTHGIASGVNFRTGEEYAEDDPRVIEARTKLLTLPIPIEFARTEHQPDAWRMTWLPGAPMPPLWPIPLPQRDTQPVSGAQSAYEISDDDLFK